VQTLPPTGPPGHSAGSTEVRALRAPDESESPHQAPPPSALAVAGLEPRRRPKWGCSPRWECVRYLDPSRSPRLGAGDDRRAGGRDDPAVPPRSADGDDWLDASARTGIQLGTAPSSRPARGSTSDRSKTADRTPAPGTGAPATPQARRSPSRPGGRTGQRKPISGSVCSSTDVGAL
jgi:hypothetical protein